MADTLRKTLNGLRGLAADHRSGAAEIADRAAALLYEFCQAERSDDSRLPYALAELAEATLTAQPSLAPLLNLANLIQLAAEQDAHTLRSLRKAVEKFRRQRQQATPKIAHHFAARSRRLRTVLTYSYSSTVLAALIAAARSGRGGSGHLQRVILSESRPLYEGRLLAERLAEKGIEVTLVIDAALREQVAAADAVVVGADTVLERAYVNRLGTALLQTQARTAGKPFFVLADTAKFLPPALAPFHRIEEKPAHEVWRDPPTGVAVVNRYFQLIPFERHVTLLSERGVMPPARLRAWVEHLDVARRWSESSAGSQP
jgi:translation initiation factor 2B subunit (eIF-2B alpha/beta/delta family)